MGMSKSAYAFERAKNVIPGGVDSPVRAFKSVNANPPFIERGKGAYLYDIDGNAYLDYVQSWGPLIFGHCDADVEKAVIEAVQKGVSFGAPTEAETALAEKIISIYDPVQMLRFVNSGTEAVMSAIRVARAYSKKDGILKFAGCYHGHSDSLLVAAGSGAATFGHPSSPGVPDDIAKHTYVATYNDCNDVEACFAASGEKIGCVIVEPLAGNMGFVPASEEFLITLRRMCDKHGAVLIFDEVMSGFRASLTGSLAFTSVRPDMATFGKVMGGGMPCAAFGGTKEIMSLLSPDGGVYQAGTLSGNPVAMAAGLAQLQKLSTMSDFYEQAGKLADMLTSGLQKCAARHNIALQTAYRGSMFGFFFHRDIVRSFDDARLCDTKLFAAFHTQMLSRGIYLAPSQYETAFICAPMNTESVTHTLDAAEDAFHSLESLQRSK